ncbi:MAG TPA: NF038122 family metalloprotease [Sphingomonas sp.]|nr:NF038122 family metalloprotease [Sphingomonas sp.]
MKISKLLLSAVALAGGLSAGQAQALTFVLNNTGGAAIGSQARFGFEIATRYWSSVFNDNAVVNLNIGFSSLAPGVLGSTGSSRSLISMQAGYNALGADRTSTLDNQAVAGLQTLGVSTLGAGIGSVIAQTNGINATNNGYVDNFIRVDADGGVNNSTLAITKANAKALGITTDVNGAAINYGTPDGSVSFSSNFAFDFDPTDGIDAQSFDFIGVAIHEIGHALGFTSGVDSYDGRTGPGGAGATAGLLEGFVVMNTLDLFRYSSTGVLDWTTQNNPYFSLDGGATQMLGNSLMSTGSFNGDGRQASHWKDSVAGAPQLGILDPTSGRGQLQEITALDLSAYDAIGWNVNFNTLANSGYRFTTADVFRQFASAVPEPGTWGMMLVGFGMMGASLRYRGRKTKVVFG